MGSCHSSWCAASLLVATQTDRPRGLPISLFAIDANDTRHHEFQSVALFLQDAAVRWRIDGMHELEGQRVQPAPAASRARGGRVAGRNSDFAVRRPTSA